MFRPRHPSDLGCNQLVPGLAIHPLHFSRNWVGSACSKHVSWLNKVEIEINVPTRQLLARYIPDAESLNSQTFVWRKQRKQPGASAI